MTSLSRIARLARIPEIHKKKRENDPRKKKRDNNEEEQPEFPLKNYQVIKKPGPRQKPMVKTQPLSSQKTARSPLDDGIGERLDLKV